MTSGSTGQDASGPGQAVRLALRLAAHAAPLLQGEAGWSRKGPLPHQASQYVSEPQLTVSARMDLPGRALALQGRAWLDHEWSDSLLPEQAGGWDWLGINLFDGSALTLFRLRIGLQAIRIDAMGGALPAEPAPSGVPADQVRFDERGRFLSAPVNPLWAGGSWRSPEGRTRSFKPEEVVMTPLRHWTSPATAASYPVAWALDTPVGRFELRALLDAQELDARASTATVYWEGLAELLAPGGGQRVGLGYLEMTGYLPQGFR